jgi:hypothetical protein
MRATLLAAILFIGGCAGQPSTTAPAAAPATATPAASQPQQTASNGELEKKRLAEAIKHGYKVVNTNGEVLYCRSDLATASHIQRNTVCLTARQIDELDQRNQRTLGTPNTPIIMPKNNMP